METKENKINNKKFNKILSLEIEARDLTEKLIKKYKKKQKSQVLF